VFLVVAVTVVALTAGSAILFGGFVVAEEEEDCNTADKNEHAQSDDEPDETCWRLIFETLLMQSYTGEKQGRGNYIPPCDPPISGTARLLSMAASWARLSTDIKKKQATKSVAYGKPLIDIVGMTRTVQRRG
jgi:hypothetical protein